MTKLQLETLQRLICLGVGLIYDYDTGMVGFYNSKNVSDMEKVSHGHEMPEGFMYVDEYGITWDSIDFMYFSTEYTLSFKPKKETAD